MKTAPQVNAKRTLDNPLVAIIIFISAFALAWTNAWWVGTLVELVFGMGNDSGTAPMAPAIGHSIAIFLRVVAILGVLLAVVRRSIRLAVAAAFIPLVPVILTLMIGIPLYLLS